MTELIHVLNDLKSGIYVRTMLKNTAKTPNYFEPGKGEMVFVDNLIRFDQVPLVTPNGDILVEGLTFEVR